MTNQKVVLARQRLRTPRAAAVAGILFAVLFFISIILLRLALPEDLAGPDAADVAQVKHRTAVTGLDSWCPLLA